MPWYHFAIGFVALAFSVICFGLYVADAVRKRTEPEQVSERMKGLTPGISPQELAAMVKTLAEALSKVGPGLVALIGAILFLLLSGSAVKVYDLLASEPANSSEADATDTEDDGNATSDAGNEANASESANAAEPGNGD